MSHCKCKFVKISYNDVADALNHELVPVIVATRSPQSHFGLDALVCHRMNNQLYCNLSCVGLWPQSSTEVRMPDCKIELITNSVTKRRQPCGEWLLRFLWPRAGVAK